MYSTKTPQSYFNKNFPFFQLHSSQLTFHKQYSKLEGNSEEFCFMLFILQQSILFFMSNLIFFLPSAGLDIGPISDDPSSLPQPNVNQSSRPLTEEQLDGILSPELDKMVTDGNSFVLLENLSRNLISNPTSNYYLFCSIPVWTWLRNRFYCIF